MRVARAFNKTKNTLVSQNVLLLETIKEKTKGMLAFREPRAVYFETRWGIYTFGMKFAIDIAVLNNGGEIIAIRKNMKPRRLFFWNPKFKKVLELPAGSAIELGNEICISP
ncbi:hypothetical protein A3I34_01475 [Candidatus Jorgensenbacteria bacterium RIFCSPLOWO2_02_FULL_45_12]|uniref:DUF192 domain-containing protein n=2 Tax=Candidatus Joergenseniibacteriota TaxID=1752739 RepID=A0A1F6BPK8_9BACT|nr:MAG: hypothetical protein UX22_C0003G0008 [Candidatus Jorgensenbacteria bacterium GW2011_GWA2_45_9]OGG38692.1 MAG: hypothetical protein A3D55_02345 [Candidatus Jorgensenbacteria bacterium RIFCSPHIGHO2_02_FULL_45_20]OGG42339.1 MAG: hypothetical protein A3I34_01475 [Candidatus Jorgensenbacteria bacterium RIFCSPLOWO2_02_FULL_45_12]